MPRISIRRVLVGTVLGFALLAAVVALVTMLIYLVLAIWLWTYHE